MRLDDQTLHALRACCRDEAAFQQLQTILAQQQTSGDPNQTRYQAILDAIPDRMFRVNRQGVYLDFAGNQEDLERGVQPESVIGGTVQDFLPPAVAQLCLDTIQKTLETGTLQTCEYELPAPPPAQEPRHYEARLVLSGHEEVLVIVQDITHRKRAEEQLRQAEEQYRSIFEAVSDGLIINDPETGRVVAANPACCAMHGFTPEEFVGLHPYAFIHPSSYPLFEQYIATVKAGLPFHCRAMDLRKDGTPFPVEVRGTLFAYGGKPHLLATLRDITEQVETETKLKAGADRDRLLGQIALRIRRSLNLDQILTTTVAEVRQFLQADRVFIGQIRSDWEGHILAESAAPEWGSILVWIGEDFYLREVRALFEQGHLRVVPDTRQPDLPPAMAEYYARCQIRASLGVPILVNDQLFGVLIVNQCSSPRHWTDFEVDLLTQLANQVAIAIQQAELYQQVQALNASLEQQVQERTAQLEQKMQELQRLSQRQDDFLHAISHDLRTPVMGMQLVLKNLQRKSGDVISLPRPVLDQMVESGDRQIQMINSILEAHSADVKGLKLNREPIELGKLTRQTVKALAPLLEESRASLNNHLPPDLPLVYADPDSVRRVLENLLTNALKHNPPGLSINLQARLEDGSVRYTVQDNGVGMPPEECQGLFERYAQSSRNRRSAGLGLGLYLCRQIIQAHGGQIGASSQPGQGATFWFTLPVAAASNQRSQTDASESLPEASA